MNKIVFPHRNIIMKLLQNLSFAFILWIQFVQCLYDPREENGGLDTPDYELEDPFDYFGERNTVKQDTYKPPKKVSDPKMEESDKECTELQEKLSTCQQSQFKLQKDLVNCKLSNETCSPDNKPYFKHFMRKFSEVMVPLEEDSNYYTMSIMLEKSQYELLRDTLNDETSNLNVVLDMALSGMKPLSVPSWRVISNQLTWPVGLLATCCFGMTAIMYYNLPVLCLKVRRRTLIFTFIVGTFIISSIWEWFRMYKKALAGKIASNAARDIDLSCSPGSMTAWTSLKIFFQSTFSTDDDVCTRYHENILVDPFFEVTPLQAAAVCASRFFAEPLKYFFSTLGEAMRLFLKELPVQWQPIGFLTVIILFIVLVIIFSGFEISSPLLRIGIGQQARLGLKQKDKEILQLKEEKEKLKNDMKEIEKNKDMLKDRLLAIIGNRSRRQIDISNHRNYGSTGISDLGIIEGIGHLQINESNVPAPQIVHSNGRRPTVTSEIINRQPVEHEEDVGEEETHNIVNREQLPATCTEHSDNEHSTDSEQNSESGLETIQASSMYESGGYVYVEGCRAQGQC